LDKDLNLTVPEIN
jgi:hypothetical protein